MHASVVLVEIRTTHRIWAISECRCQFQRKTMSVRNCSAFAKYIKTLNDIQARNRNKYSSELEC